MQKKVLVGLALVVLMFGMVGIANATFVSYTDTFNDFAFGSDNTSTTMTAQYTTTGLNVNPTSGGALVFDILADMGDVGEWLTITANGLDFDIKKSADGVGDNFSNQRFIYSLAPTEINTLVGSGTIDWTLSFAGIADFGPDSPYTQYSQEYVTFLLEYDAILPLSPGGETPVPEPSTILLLGGGLAGLAFYRRKKN